MKKIIIFILLLACLSAYGQEYTGKIVDAATHQPVIGAEVSLQETTFKAITNEQGEFRISTSVPDIEFEQDFEIFIQNGILQWSAKKNIQVKLLNILGQNAGFNQVLPQGTGSFSLPITPNGVYLLCVTVNKSTKTFKLTGKGNFYFGKQSHQGNPKSLQINKDTLVITKNGFYFQKYEYQEPGHVYGLLKLNYNNPDYLEFLPRPEAFALMQGLPLTPKFGEVKSIKIVYSIPDGKIYYANSQKFSLHYDFAAIVLKYPKSVSFFNTEQYKKNPNRIYFLGTLNHFTSSDTYALEFFPIDEADCNEIKRVYDKIAATTYIGNKLKYYPTSAKWNTCSAFPIITVDELYQGQNYQPLNTQESYGYLRKIPIEQVPLTYLGRHDIVLMNGIPIDISVVAGMITTEFQTPMSHINVLSHNRGTPNMALRDGWTNPKLTKYIGKLVYFRVTLDSFYIREATLTEAQQFWSVREPHTVQKLNIDTLTSGIIDLTKVGVESVKTVGGKAANFGELSKVYTYGYGPIPLPEGKFAIPFSYYWKHIKKYGLDAYINNMLKDDTFWSDVKTRQAKLFKLQDSIKKCPIDTDLLTLIYEKLNTVEGYNTFRFRSSTNAEDITGFNGAGLYDSYTGSFTDPDKPIDKAIKKTWASLWNFQAFEEREYFKIDHRSVAMGVLINRSFPAEAANGVVITENLFSSTLPAITINVQVGEISVVKPTENFLPDQVIYYTFTENLLEYISHSNVPGMEGKTVMTDAELKTLRDFCLAIHYHYCSLYNGCNPIDIEFKIDIVDGIRKLYIKQARRY